MTSRLLFSTAPFFRKPLSGALPPIADAGFEAVEVMVTQDPATQDPGLLTGALRDHGLEIGAIHAPFIVFTRRVWGTDPAGKVKRAVELAGQVGVPLVVIHPPFRWQRNYRRWLDEEMHDLAASSGVTVAVENMFPMVRGLGPHSVHTPEHLSPYADVTLDTSHAAVAGLDLLEARRALGSQLRHVHLSNNGGRGWDSHLPVDEGVLPIGEFLDDLTAGGFDGSISLELDLRRWSRDPAGLRAMLAEQRRLCEGHIAAPAAAAG